MIPIIMLTCMCTVNCDVSSVLMRLRLKSANSPNLEKNLYVMKSDLEGASTMENTSVFSVNATIAPTNTTITIRIK